jgi:hypothetical protein
MPSCGSASSDRPCACPEKRSPLPTALQRRSRRAVRVHHHAGRSQMARALFNRAAPTRHPRRVRRPRAGPAHLARGPRSDARSRPGNDVGNRCPAHLRTRMWLERRLSRSARAATWHWRRGAMRRTSPTTSAGSSTTASTGCSGRRPSIAPCFKPDLRRRRPGGGRRSRRQPVRRHGHQPWAPRAAVGNHHQPAARGPHRRGLVGVRRPRAATPARVAPRVARGAAAPAGGSSSVAQDRGGLIADEPPHRRGYSQAVRARTAPVSPILDRGEGRFAVGPAAEARGAAVGDRPYVGDPDGDLDAAGAARGLWRTMATRCSPRSMTSSGSMWKSWKLSSHDRRKRSND